MQPIKISQNDGIPESCLLENVDNNYLPAKYEYMTNSDNIDDRMKCSTRTQTNTVIQSHQNDSNHNSTN